ncbi:MAG: Tm-1-like ATP-binding domain-containing protein [Burkholderiales bacterium]
MRKRPCVLVLGTADTKSAELQFLVDCILEQDAQALVMDVGVLGLPVITPDIRNDEVALAAGSTLAAVAALGDENAAMQSMARGATALACQLQRERRIDGMLALGGTMGTDLALEVAGALPIGFPKVLLSTVAHSHLLPPERIPADLIALLWAGGLYGLNEICRATLRQAAGAVVGASRIARPLKVQRPMVGMTSLGSTTLRYMKRLMPELEARGYEVAVFHSSGMGGLAFERLAAERRFEAVFDFCLQELANDAMGSSVTAGPNRLRGAGLAGIPQIVAPGAVDMVDYPAWGAPPAPLAGAAVHTHNRLVASAALGASPRRELAREIALRLNAAQGPVCLLLPTDGVDEWDRPGGPMHNATAHQAFSDMLRSTLRAPVELREVQAHINDDAFCQAALQVFDHWVQTGLVQRAPLDQR